MKDYTKGKIYKYVNIYDESLIYVGSTTKTLEERHYKHTEEAKYNPTPFHRFVDGKWDNWKHIYIEDYPCGCESICEKIECGRKLAKREGKFIREMGVLNYSVAGRTPKEYYQDNLEHCRERCKIYSKQYGDLHREEIREKWKIYFEEKKDEINKKRREKWAENREENNRKQQERRALKKAQQNGV